MVWLAPGSEDTECGSQGAVGVAVHLAHPFGGLYVTAMRVRRSSHKAPRGSAWVHEIKHDGYRLMARRDGNRVRLFTRRGYDWSAKYPWIVESLLSLRVRSITVDGEAVWAGTDGKSDFDKLHSGGHDGEVFLVCLRPTRME
jgi:ATP-dependent DNA ligase